MNLPDDEQVDEGINDLGPSRSGQARPKLETGAETPHLPGRSRRHFF
ncbi:MAG: hypothetical protein ACKV19_25600 [Verrucomicrobiales bacterium]